MTGEYMHTLDAKGRLAVPSRLRDELGGIFYVTLLDGPLPFGVQRRELAALFR